MDPKKLTEQIRRLKSGEKLFYSGTLYTARDQAHKRLVEAIKKEKKLPIDLKGAVLYYCGPTKKPRGKAIGACGPTTASRMDNFTPALLKAGILAMIGKGRRSPEVVKAIKKFKAVYFLTYAGCGALLAQCVRRLSLVTYPDLGPEAIYKLEVKDFPLIVGIDSRGKDIYEFSRKS